jgi:hypothetical protein
MRASSLELRAQRRDQNSGFTRLPKMAPRRYIVYSGCKVNSEESFRSFADVITKRLYLSPDMTATVP